MGKPYQSNPTSERTPAPTIQAQPGPYVGPFHWDNRRLRVAEVKRLFTYPDDFELVGSRASVQAQLERRSSTGYLTTRQTRQPHAAGLAWPPA